MVRGKIELKFIQDKQIRVETFKRRKQGALKKLSELSTMCNTKVALIMFDDREGMHVHSSGDTTELVMQFLRQKVHEGTHDAKELLDAAEEFRSLEKQRLITEEEYAMVLERRKERIKESQPSTVVAVQDPNAWQTQYPVYNVMNASTPIQNSTIPNYTYSNEMNNVYSYPSQF